MLGWVYSVTEDNPSPDHKSKILRRIEAQARFEALTIK